MINDLLTAIGLTVIRAVGGWATEALKDGVISKFEYRKLGETVLRATILSCLIYYGADGFGLDLTVIASTSSAILLDLIISKKSNS